jgi:metal-dependent hydrolase (beta-lactamase superfamily II)
LRQLGVSPKLIDKVILTHCHADHDAGTLQKILQEGRINLYTTQTIFQSFLRKSTDLTGITMDRILRLVSFFPVQIGKQMIIGGGTFLFNYTLHSIPTISIQASLYGKSMIYSSDTMNEPAYINSLYE